jgi:ribosomal-protein-alanine N-acetyltransferase
MKELNEATVDRMLRLRQIDPAAQAAEQQAPIYVLDADYYVRLLDESDLDGPYPRWFQDQEVCRYNSHGKFFKTKSHFQAYLAGLGGEDRVVWAVCHVDDGHVGNVTLQQISFINRTAEFAIILGDKRHWGRGVGRLAGRMLLRHGFEKLNLERIYCATAASNHGMSKLAAALYMKLEGTRRGHLYLDGARVDVLEFGVLREEFE